MSESSTRRAGHRLAAAFTALWATLGLLPAGGCRPHATLDAPVLMYHSVEPDPGDSVWSVSTHAFDRQLADLARQGYTSILPRDLARARRGWRRLPPKPVILTFDDGLLNNLQHAEPLLRRHGFRAICYLIIDRIADTPTDRRTWRQAPCLTWEEVRAMQRRGTFSFGVHSLAHTPDPRREAETVASARQAFRRRTGRSPDSFCYPHGQAPDVLREAVQAAGFTTAMVCEDTWHVFSPTNDLLRIPRVSVYGGRHDQRHEAHGLFREAAAGMPAAASPQPDRAGEPAPAHRPAVHPHPIPKHPPP